LETESTSISQAVGAGREERPPRRGQYGINS